MQVVHAMNPADRADPVHRLNQDTARSAPPDSERLRNGFEHEAAARYTAAAS
ncbi:hypothetical protein YUWDRAFT_04073 [Streptomyces sp. AmelKG-D3]|nr:hypothetical protein YUWDRAFT_04073 [Streptomyces sp. AmelKG-D3]